MCPSLSTMKTSHKRKRILSNTAFQHTKRFCLADASRLCDKLSPWWRVWLRADRTRTEQTYDVFVHKQAASSSIVSVTRLVWHFVWHWGRESLAPHGSGKQPASCPLSGWKPHGFKPGTQHGSRGLGFRNDGYSMTFQSMFVFLSGNMMIKHDQTSNWHKFGWYYLVLPFCEKNPL